MQIENNALENSISDLQDLLTAGSLSGVNGSGVVHSQQQETNNNTEHLSSDEGGGSSRSSTTSSSSSSSSNTNSDTIADDRSSRNRSRSLSHSPIENNINSNNNEARNNQSGSQDNYELAYWLAATRSSNEFDAEQQQFDWQFAAATAEDAGFFVNGAEEIKDEEDINAVDDADDNAPDANIAPANEVNFEEEAYDSESDSPPFYLLPSPPASAATYVEEVRTPTPVESVKEEISQPEAAPSESTEAPLSEAAINRIRAILCNAFETSPEIEEAQPHSTPLQPPPLTPLNEANTADFVKPLKEIIENETSTVAGIATGNEQIENVANAATPTTQQEAYLVTHQQQQQQQLSFEQELPKGNIKRPPPNLIPITGGGYYSHESYSRNSNFAAYNQIQRNAKEEIDQELAEDCETFLSSFRQYFEPQNIIGLPNGNISNNELTETQEVYNNQSNNAVADQMGIDIFWNKVRRFFSYATSSESEQENKSYEEKNRKRRSYNVAHTSEQQFKYRRVDNSFPRIAKPQMDEQGGNALRNFQTMSGNNSMRNGRGNGMGGIGMPKKRLSIFDAPHSTRKLIQTPNCIAIDLSDDDDKRPDKTFSRNVKPQLDEQDGNALRNYQNENNSMRNGRAGGSGVGGGGDGGIGMPKTRRSIFDAPRTTRKLIQNQNCIAIDLSDDDEEVVANPVGAVGSAFDALIEQGYSGRNLKSTSSNNWQAMPQAQRAQPPPLLDTHTGEYVAAPAIGASFRNKTFSYADAVRHGTNAISNNGPGNGYYAASNMSMLNDQHAFDYARSSSLSSHDVSTAGSVRLNAGNSLWNGAPMQTILTHANIREEHAQYLRFLEEVIPSVYGAAVDDIQTRQQEQRQQRRSQVGDSFQHHSQRGTPQRLPLSSTINLDDFEDDSQDVQCSTDLQKRVSKLLHENDIDNDADDDDLQLISELIDITNEPDYTRSPAVIQRGQRVTKHKQQQQHQRQAKLNKNNNGIPVIELDDDDNDADVVALSADKDDDVIEVGPLPNSKTMKNNTNGPAYVSKFDKMKIAANNLHNKKPDVTVKSYNTLELRFRNSDLLRKDWEPTFLERWRKARENRVQQKNLIEDELNVYSEGRLAVESEVRRRISQIHLLDQPLIVSAYELEAEESAEDVLKPLTEQHRRRIIEAIEKPHNHILISKFNLNIRRCDLDTLTGGNWLNDEVINFYMNLLTERSEQRAGVLPGVYAMSTFFVTRLMTAGYAGVRRWTRRVDLFSKDVIPVPVHVGGVHWCMAVIHLRDKSIKYYDSMGKPNVPVLRALEQYIQQESLDKRQTPLDTSQFVIESVTDVPHQTNGSDCGVFSCMFAEYITRDKPITFSQDNMEYFRQKMMLEILDGQLWN